MTQTTGTRHIDPDLEDVLIDASSRSADHGEFEAAVKTVLETINAAIRTLGESSPWQAAFEDHAWVLKEGQRRSVLQIDGLTLYVGRSRQTTRTVSGLRYNRLTKALEAEDFSKVVAPTPGEPRPRRSAAAVILEAVLKEMGSF